MFSGSLRPCGASTVETAAAPLQRPMRRRMFVAIRLFRQISYTGCLISIFWIRISNVLSGYRSCKFKGVKRNDTAIDQDLALYGIAQVIVSYTAHDLGAKREAMGAVEKCFTSSTMSQMSALALADGKPSPPKVIHFRHLGVSLGTVDPTGLQALRAESRVADIFATPVLSLVRTVKKMDASLADVAGELTWGLQLLQVKRVWDAGFTGQGVSVGHLDTGIDGTHPALARALAHYAVFDDLG